MKKFLILIAFVAISMFTEGYATPVAKHNVPNLENLRLLPVEAKALTKSATVLDEVLLNSISKHDDKFQADDLTNEFYNYFRYINDEGVEAEELIEMAAGQIWEMGSGMNYYIDYDPYTKYVFGIAAARYGHVHKDSITKRGLLTFGKFEPGEKMASQMSQAYLYDTADLTPNATTTYPKDVLEWAFPTIVVANPNQSTRLADLKFAISMSTDLLSKNTTTTTGRSTRYNTISLFNASALFNSVSSSGDFMDSISYDYLSEPYLNRTVNYSFARSLKGHKAYFKDETGKMTPFALFFGPVFNSAAPTTSNFKFGVISVRLDNIPAKGKQNNIDSNIHHFQFLSADIENILGAGITLGSADDQERGFNLDYDENSNLYLALFETKKEYMEETLRHDDFKVLQTPMVIKSKYNFNTTEVDPARKDIITEFELDTMPFSVLKNYIESFEVEYEDYGLCRGTCVITDGGTCPQFAWSGMSLRADLPFVVTAEDEYSFVTPIRFTLVYGEDKKYTYEQQIIEITKDKTVGWQIKKIGDIYSSGYPGVYSSSLSYFFVNQGKTYLWNTGRLDGVNGGGGTVISPELQISKTADNQYLIAKWQDCLPEEYIRLTEPISGFYNSAEELVTVDSFFTTSLYLSYRHVDSANWSTPVRASHLNYPDSPADWDPLRDTLTIMGSYMPRVVPDIDNVIMSVACPMDQGNAIQVNFKDKIVKTRVQSYVQHNIIAPSAVTGWKYVSIEEGEPATMDHLAPAYPNPTSSTVNFSFSILKPANTTLTISNSLGQEVAVVVNQFCNASDYSVEYNVAKLPVGVYYFTLASGDVRQTKIFTIAR